MKKIVLTFGFIAGLIVSAMMVITYPFQDQITSEAGMVIGYAGMLASSMLIYFGIRSYRDNVAGGRVGFGRAFAIEALILAVSSTMYTATWEVIYFGLRPDFLAKYQAHQLDVARAKGATPAELELKIAEHKRNAELYENPAFNAAITFCEPLPPGLLVTLISAIMLSRKRRSSGLEPRAPEILVSG
jgi:hypothetical protein